MGFVPTAPPAAGCYVSGLRLNNATWNTASNTIVPCDSEEIINAVPILHIQPVLHSDVVRHKHVFVCPVILSNGDISTPTDSIILEVNVAVTSDQVARDLKEKNVHLASHTEAARK